MNKEIKTLVDSLREQTVGKTCMGTGNFSFDVITQQEYPDGFVVGKRNKSEERILKMEVGNTCGNVMTMLPYLGVKTFPVAKLDMSPHGYQMKRDMKAYGADVRYVSNTLSGATTILRCVHKLDKEGKPTMGHKGSTAGKPWNGPSARPARKYLSSQNGEVDAMVDAMDFTPDVFFFDIVQAGHRLLAERLREKGTLVYFEGDSNWNKIQDEKQRQAAYRAFLRCVDASDVVKMSGELVKDPLCSPDPRPASGACSRQNSQAFPRIHPSRSAILHWDGMKRSTEPSVSAGVHCQSCPLPRTSS